MKSLKGNLIWTVKEMRTELLPDPDTMLDDITERRLNGISTAFNDICISIQFKIELYVGAREGQTERRLPSRA